jgi:UDP-sulfoquinovose synthase
MRILNQFTERFSVRQLAERVTEVGNRLGLGVRVASVANPRKEKEEHYYNPKHQALLDLGLKPHYLTDDVLADLLDRVQRHRSSIAVERIMPRVRWSDDAASVSAPAISSQAGAAHSQPPIATPRR